MKPNVPPPKGIARRFVKCLTCGVEFNLAEVHICNIPAETLHQKWVGSAYRRRKGEQHPFTVFFETIRPACRFWALQYFKFDHPKASGHIVQADETDKNTNETH